MEQYKRYFVPICGRLLDFAQMKSVCTLQFSCIVTHKKKNSNLCRDRDDNIFETSESFNFNVAILFFSKPLFIVNLQSSSHIDAIFLPFLSFIAKDIQRDSSL